MDIQRIIILAGLAITTYLLILAWNDDYGNQPVPLETSQSATVPTGQSLDTVPQLDQSAPIAGEIPAVEGENAPLTQVSQSIVTVSTDVFEVTIDLLGGDIIRTALPAFPVALDTPDSPFVLIDPRNQFAVQTGLIGRDGTDKPGSRPLFSASQTHYEMGEQEELVVSLQHHMDSGVVVIKRYRFNRADYLIDIEYEVGNSTGSPIQTALFAQLRRDSLPPAVRQENSMGLQPFVGGATATVEALYHKLEFDDLEEESFRQKTTAGYMAMVQHYFVTALVPVADEAVNYSARKLSGRDLYVLGFTSSSWTIEAGETLRKQISVYAGPKDQYRLQEIAAGLDLTVDYGFLWWLAQPLFYLLTFIHGYVNNWGVAIILLTVVVKSLLYPLSAASFRSMAKMRRLQPEMTRLKERYGDDRQQFSQAMMDLYKKEGANPLGGCLPILLQMPVFLALYWSLMESVELRQAPFMLWIDDLSVMDPYFVLPILMGISMFLTQMMQPEPPDPVQAKVFKMMPIIFTFFFLWFPSGLVLYWLVNNMLSIFQQWIVTRQLDAGKS